MTEQLELGTEVDADETAERKTHRLFPFQVVGRDWLRANDNAILCDDMGVGKTVQVCAALQGEPVLVVAPPTAVGVWKAHFKEWQPDYKVTACDKLRGFPQPKEAFILPSSRLPRHPGLTLEDEQRDTADWTYGRGKRSEPVVPRWDGMHPDTTVVIDELHDYKNEKSARYQDMTVIMNSNPKRRWGLTGTPLLSYATDLWALFKLIGVERTAYRKGFRAFREAYGAELVEVPIKGGGKPKKVYKWGTPPKELQSVRQEAIERVSLRRTKEQVAPWLPKKRREFIEVPYEEDEEVEAMRETWMEDGERILRTMASPSTVDFSSISSVRAQLALQKMKAAVEIVEKFESIWEPLVVFSAHRNVVEKIGARKGWARIYGGTPIDIRTRICEEFQKGNLRGIAANIKAAGVGITLTNGANGLFVDRDWTSELNRQAEDRLYRIGQTKPVRIMILVTSHPVDIRVEEVLTRKENLVRSTFRDIP